MLRTCQIISTISLFLHRVVVLAIGTGSCMPVEISVSTRKPWYLRTFLVNCDYQICGAERWSFALEFQSWARRDCEAGTWQIVAYYLRSIKHSSSTHWRSKVVKHCRVLYGRGWLCPHQCSGLGTGALRCTSPPSSLSLSFSPH